MQILDWNDIRYFLEVVRSGSAIQAAIQLGINHTTVYRRISALEKRLGKILFERSANGWILTPVGESISAFAESMSEDANNIERHILADSHELSGLLRITVPTHALRSLAAPAIRLFTQRYPDINLEVITTSDELDLAALEADVALRGTDAPPPNLVGKCIGQIGFAVYGTKALLEQATADPNAVDLPCITWVGDDRTRPSWINHYFPNTQRIYRTTSFHAMLEMAREGIGIAQLGCVLGDPDPKLQRLTACVVESGPGLWVLTHVELRTTARVRIFRDFLVQELEKQKNLFEGKLPKAYKIPV